MKYSKVGSATVSAKSIYVFLDIGSWETMKKVRAVLGRWLPNETMWKSENHWVEQKYFRNNFKWDGEYAMYLPLAALKDCEKILKIKYEAPSSLS